jgi:hypothetical protein
LEEVVGAVALPPQHFEVSGGFAHGPKLRQQPAHLVAGGEREREREREKDEAPVRERVRERACGF